MWNHNNEDTNTIILDDNDIDNNIDNETKQTDEPKPKEEKNYVFLKNYNTSTPFNFKSYKNFDGWIFVLITLLLPFLINIIVTYAFPISHHTPIDPSKDGKYLSSRLLLDVVSWIIIGATMIYFWIKYGKKFIKSGGIIPFYFIFFMPIIINIIFIIIGSFSFYTSASTNVQNIISTIVQVICELIIIILIFTINKDILKRLKSFFKEFYISLPIILCGIAGYFVLEYIFSQIGNLLPATHITLYSTDNSNNQDQLNQLLNTVPGIITLGIFTIIVAPITEELTTRHGIYAMSSNKWLGLVASALYFAGMHVSEYGDWQHIFDYLGAGIALSFVFLFSNGNVYCTISIHSIINIISFISILVEHSHK